MTLEDQPLVCICIPNYNNEKTISETLDSLLNQTYKNIKIKIFDNQSTDNSMKILKEYASKYVNIHVYQNETNIGGEANFTKCIQNLEGDFGAVFHADDFYTPTMIEEQVIYLLEKEISAIFVRANLIDENSNDIGEQFFPEELKNKIYHQFNFEQLFSLILKYDNFLITPSVMARTDIYKNQIKDWNGEIFKTSADLDVWLRFSEIKDIGIITDKLISYRVSTASYSYRNKFTRISPRDMFLVIDYYLKKYSNVNFNKDNYAYLKFKDTIIIVGNKIFLNHTIDSSEIPIKVSLLKIILQDKQKIKIFIYACLLKLLTILHMKNSRSMLVRQVNKL